MRRGFSGCGRRRQQRRSPSRCGPSLEDDSSLNRATDRLPPGLNYLNNRYYDSATGVFLSVDPLVSGTGEPYLYASGNPSTLSDPSGLCPTDTAAAAACYAAWYNSQLPGLSQNLGAPGSSMEALATNGIPAYGVAPVPRCGISACPKSGPPQSPKDRVQNGSSPPDAYDVLAAYPCTDPGYCASSLDTLIAGPKFMVYVYAPTLLGGAIGGVAGRVVTWGARWWVNRSTATEPAEAPSTFGPSGKPDFTNPANSPGAGWVWRGNGPPGSNQGNWVLRGTKEYLHTDLHHPPGIAPHYDWRSPGGVLYRVFKDGSTELKP